MVTMQYLKNVVTLELDQDKCIGCGMCVMVCPHAVFEMAMGKSAIAVRDNCMECGACAMNCPVEAISVRSGVGCAAGIIAGKLAGSEPCCGGPDPETPEDAAGANGNGSCCCSGKSDGKNKPPSKPTCCG